MKHNDQTGVIVPFRQNAAFYYQRGSKYLSDGDMIRAEQYLRKACKMEPGNEDHVLAFAETLYRMHMYEESLTVLLNSLCEIESPSAEIVFGIASDMMSLEEFSAAKQCCRICIERGADDPYAARAKEMLDLIEDEPDLEAQIGLNEDEDLALLDLIHRAKSKHFSFKDDAALNSLLLASDRYPNSEMLDMEIAMMLFSMQEYDEAKRRLFNLFKRNSKSVRGNALMTLIYHIQKQKEEASEQSKKIIIDAECSPEELGYAAPIFLEIGEIDRAMYALELLRESLPYDVEMLHQLAYCYYVKGRKNEAERIYEDLCLRDEGDSVAAYYKKHIKEDSEDEFKRSWSINYDVPIREAVVRQRRLRDIATAGEEALLQAWENDKEFRGVLKWGLLSPLSPSLRASAKMLSLIKSKEAENALRSFLIRLDQADEDKQFVFGLLLGREAKPPFTIYYQGDWQYGVAHPVSIPEHLPISYESILDYINDFGRYLHGDIRFAQTEVPARLGEFSSRIFFLYIASFDGGKFPHIRKEQERAMAAAFILMGLSAFNNVSVKPEDLIRVFDVSERRLENALKKILTALHTDKEQ